MTETPKAATKHPLSPPAVTPDSPLLTGARWYTALKFYHRRILKIFPTH